MSLKLGDFTTGLCSSRALEAAADSEGMHTHVMKALLVVALATTSCTIVSSYRQAMYQEPPYARGQPGVESPCFTHVVTLRSCH